VFRAIMIPVNMLFRTLMTSASTLNTMIFASFIT